MTGGAMCIEGKRKEEEKEEEEEEKGL